MKLKACVTAVAFEVYTQQLPIYDAGTELSSEMPLIIPGPAAGGEGCNSAGDDVGFVAMHPGR